MTAIIGQFITDKYPFFNYGFSFDKKDVKAVKDEVENQLKEEQKNTSRNIYNFIVNQMNSKCIEIESTGEVIWEGSKTIEKIKKYFDYKDYFFSYLSRDDDGELYKATLYPKGDPDAKISIKNNLDTAKYGGYTSASYNKQLVVKYTKGKKQNYKIISLPIMYEKDPNSFIQESIKTDEFEIVQTLRKGQIFIEDNNLYTLVSEKEKKSVAQIFLSPKDIETMHNLKTHVPCDENDVNELYINILNKISTKDSKLTKQCEKLKEDEFVNYFKSLENDKKYELISTILSSFKSGSNNIKNGKGEIVVSRFGRLISGPKLEKMIVVHTSPSGIYYKKNKILK